MRLFVWCCYCYWFIYLLFDGRQSVIVTALLLLLLVLFCMAASQCDVLLSIHNCMTCTVRVYVCTITGLQLIANPCSNESNSPPRIRGRTGHVCRWISANGPWTSWTFWHKPKKKKTKENNFNQPNWHASERNTYHTQTHTQNIPSGIYSILISAIIIMFVVFRLLCTTFWCTWLWSHWHFDQWINVWHYG